LGFHQELELIANQKNEEKIKRQNVRKIQENIVFTIDLVKEEMEKKPNVKTRLDLD